MNHFTARAGVTLALAFSTLWVRGQASTEEPAIRPDPRPTDLTGKDRRDASDDPNIRRDPRPLDVSIPKKLPDQQYEDISGLSLDQAEKLRAIRQRAEEEIQAIRHRARAEIIAILNEQQRGEFVNLEEKERAEGMRRVTSTPTTIPSE